MIVEEPTISDTSMYGIKDAARVLGVSYQSIRRYLAEGTLKCIFHPGIKRKLITGKELKRFWRGKF